MMNRTATVTLFALQAVAVALGTALIVRETTHVLEYGLFNRAELTPEQASLEEQLGSICEFGHPNDKAAQDDCFVRLSLKRLREDDDRLGALMDEQQANEILPLTK